MIPESWNDNWKRQALNGDPFAIKWCNEHGIKFRNDEEEDYDKFVEDWHKNPDNH